MSIHHFALPFNLADRCCELCRYLRPITQLHTEPFNSFILKVD